MTRFIHPRTEDLTLPAVLHALGDPVRLRLVTRLADDAEHHCAAMLEGEGVPKSTQSHHMRILREAGIIRGEISGPRSCYCLDRAALASVARAMAILDDASAIEPVGEPS